MDQTIYASRDSATEIFNFTWVLLIASLFYLEACIIFEFLLKIKTSALKAELWVQTWMELHCSWVCRSGVGPEKAPHVILMPTKVEELNSSLELDESLQLF